MLAKENRLKKRKQFNYIFKNGASFFSKNFSLFFTNVNNGLKIGFSVSKKVGNAVTRNKLKRKMRAVIREYVPSIQKGTYIIIQARPSAKEKSFDELKKELFYLINKSGLIQKGEA